MAGRVDVTSSVRGRVRVRVDGLHRDRALGLFLRERLGADERVTHVSASDVTGNVLVRFDGGRLGLAELERHVAAAVAGYRPRRMNGAAVAAPPPSFSAAWHTRPVAEVVRALNRSPEVGLSSAEAARRLVASGPNRLPARPPKSALAIVWDQVGSLPTALLGAAPSQRSFVGIQHSGETPTEAPNDPTNPTQFSSWPDGPAGGRPRSACVVVTRDDGGPISGPEDD
jgi:hypothetical protein